MKSLTRRATLAALAAVLLTPAARAGEGAQSFLLLLREDARYRGAASDEPKRIEEYSAWARGLAEQGKLSAGEKLANKGVVLSGTGERPTSRSEQPGGKKAGVAGFFIIAAASQSDALAIARTCPHVRHGGTIELRPIERIETK